MRRNEAIRIRQLIEKSVSTLDDEEALEAPMLFPAFDPNEKSYTTGDRFTYEGKLYKVLQDHTSQTDWLPTTAVSLYVEVTPPDTIAAWKQPLGAQDAYQLGDKVTHNGKTWESTVVDNVWEPSVFGWEEI
jgi:chitodextrinase